ncbi:DUF3080 domain-containing protein [Vibrio tubiashii]|uniref:DUF3080 domain-containing protein n=1 Tax=Vibrio tubiashii ATCC 19109 TaxID=1051646 RepID=F9TCK6_9VIBR|nr:DUF3080 domain-containing protein [Vibrio tubiashii]AIW14677.1 hypothetical protein IX91_10765 [Vibrio tubiashii ATCC 19109]EGU47669.1 hypothetical protein VITU9109_20631 [Vibrio tubiashii ATCC 19109]EIF02376.1 hypothetical protein VT1337_18993 [Vibrio tubiashii NCIMB 1337 = ATCC 19106]
MTKARSVLISVILLTLVACQTDSPSHLFDDYLTRVARVQDAPKVNKDTVSYAQLPRKRDLYVDVPSVSIGLLDSYQLRQCGLFNLIAEKNSVLGKVADEFRNYDYQTALLDGLSQCINSNGLEPDLVMKLVEIQQQKQSQFEVHHWNLIFASDAMQKQLSGTQWLEPNLGQTVVEINQALATLNRASDSVSNQVIDVQEVLEKKVIVGNLSYSLAMATSKLNHVTQQLTEYDHNIICAQNRDTTKFKYLNNVFEQQFVGKVQPYMAQLDGYYQTLSSNLNLFDPKPNIHRYVYPLKNHHMEFRQAIRRHVDYWQQLFKRCGRKVG